MSAKDNNDAKKKNLMNTTEIAILLGVTARRVQQLTQDGIFLKENSKSYDAPKAVQAYIEFISAKNKPENKETENLELKKLNAEARYKDAKATKSEIELAEYEGKMHAADDVESMTSDLILYIRGQLLGMPGRLSIDLDNIETISERSEIINRNVTSILQSITDYEYDPTRYKERVRERLGWDAIDAND